MSSAELYRAQDVLPTRSDAEYRLVLETIHTLTAKVTDETQVRHLLALQQRARAYEQRQRVDSNRLQALEELAAQAQELKMGCD